MATIGGPNVVEDGLVLALDAANSKSYPGSGTTWSDLSGNGNSGTLINGPTFSSENGGSIVFDGVDDYVEHPLYSNSIDKTLTYEIFIKPKNIDSSLRMYIGNSNLASNYVGINNGKAFLSIRTTTAQRTITHSQTLNNDEIYHIVSTYDEVRPRIYVNSVVTEGLIRNEPLLRWGYSDIGRYRSVDPRLFAGEIYYVRVYKIALTTAEVLQNYNATKSRFGL
jgi:hypothetical protein